jgi:hypothetical protein
MSDVPDVKRAQWRACCRADVSETRRVDARTCLKRGVLTSETRQMTAKTRVNDRSATPKNVGTPQNASPSAAKRVTIRAAGRTNRPVEWRNTTNRDDETPIPDRRETPKHQHKKPPPKGRLSCLNRRRPTLPGPCGPSTIGAEGLNCSVRNGKRCFPLAVTTGKL